MDRYEAEEAAARSTRVYPWWTLLVPLVAVLLLLWWLALRPLVGVFAPSWQATTWHLLDSQDDTLVLLVEYLDCGGLGVEAPAVRFEVSESPTEVDVDAFVAGEAVPIPTACAGHRLTSESVVLEGPLGTRALHGCRHEHSGLLETPPDGCEQLSEEFGL